MKTAPGPAPRSLRAELTRSHAALVALIVVAFGSILFALIARATYHQAESDLLGAAQMLAQDVRNGADPSMLTIPEPFKHRFGKAPRDHAYFAIWDVDGEQVGGAGKLPPQAGPVEVPPSVSGPHPFVKISYGKHLDVIVSTPDGGQVLVGRPLAKEFDGFWRLLGQIILIGIVCLMAGTAGAWWLAKRISDPIAKMAATAESITSRSLDDRLDIGASVLEIGQLERSFNTMLDGLQLAFKNQVRFTADASHELRTPVSIVLSQAEHSLSRERSADDYKEALRTCLRAGRRMKTLVDDLLLLAKADSGRLDLNHNLVDLGEIAGKIADLMQPLAIKHQVSIETRIEPAPIFGDAARLSQVVTNLVTNAILYNIAGGDVVVSVSSTGEPQPSAILKIEDHGQGIPLEDQPRIFDRFHRVDAARSLEEGSGTGLGLSLVAEIVAAHDGTIEVESKLAQGTTITVTFPSATPENRATIVSHTTGHVRHVAKTRSL